MVYTSFSDANILNIFSRGSLLPEHTVHAKKLNFCFMREKNYLAFGILTIYQSHDSKLTLHINVYIYQACYYKYFLKGDLEKCIYNYNVLFINSYCKRLTVSCLLFSNIEQKLWIKHTIRVSNYTFIVVYISIVHILQYLFLLVKLYALL